MDPRTFSQRFLPRLVAGFDRFNARHPWRHNDHFHRWILRHLPERRRRALDVGCGRGELLARLAACVDRVEGTDRDPAMRAAATQRVASYAHVSVSGDQLADLDGDYDAITMVASLHHLDVPAALAECRRLLAPGGRLLVVGLARPETARDWAWDAVGLLTNPVIGFVKHPRVAPAAPAGPGVPVMDPHESFDELRALFADAMPGAQLRRRVGFRYTASWTKPTG